MVRLFAAGLCSLLLLWALGAFANNDRAAGFYEDAVRRLDRRGLAGAIIQLKNALQDNPSMLAAHVLIGRAFLENFQPEGAEISFERAIKLGIDRTEVAVPLAQALLMQGKAREVLERFAPEVLIGTQRAQLMVLRSQAHKQLGELGMAATALEEARAQDPGSVLAQLALADLLSEKGQQKDALALASKALEVAPSDPRAWYVIGSIHHFSGDAPKALQAYDKALQLAPRYADARIARVTLLMSTGRLRETAADWDFFRKEHPDEPRSNYLRAVYSARIGDIAGAKEGLSRAAKVLGAIPLDVMKQRAPDVLALTGTVYFGLEEYEKARKYLESYIAIVPNEVPGRRMLGAVYIRRNDAVSAIKALEPAYRLAPRDPGVLTLLGEAYLARGRGQAAMELFQKAADIRGATPALQTTLALSMLQVGQPESAIEQLGSVLGRDSGQRGASVVLALTYLRAGEPRKAVAAMEKSALRHPEDPNVLNVLGVSHMAARDITKARAAYEKALQLAPAFEPAALNLAKLEVYEGKHDSARARLRTVLQSNGRSVQAMHEFAKLEATAGRAAESLAWYEKLITMDSRYLPGSIGLVEAYRDRGEHQKALDLVRNLGNDFPEDMDVLAAEASVHLAMSNFQAAQTVLARMDRLTKDPVRYVQVASMQLRAGNPGGAAYSLEKALSIYPDLLPAQILLVEAESARGNASAAEARARALTKTTSGGAAGYRLLGDIQFRQGRFADALASYRSALTKERTTENALRNVAAMLKMGSGPKAVEFLDAWIAEHPHDLVARRGLGDLHLRLGNIATAQGTYEALLAVNARDVASLNGLSNAFMRRGEYAKAVQTAEKAAKVAPEDPIVLDTLGWALAKSGATDAALSRLRDARLRNPRLEEIRYHLAAVLAKLGRDNEAVDEIGSAIGPNADYPEIEDARMLARRLGLR
ncbi:MAG: PEP-CTERM system TPR-repeat protein PrsT [Betaproteobacteria bacterium]|nr:PEP-CTERM system TPR-repeat protein PrsT [Betaproteobacteria bacterium]